MRLNWNVNASWTLFLDRDGVINERIWNGYVLNYNEFSFRKNTLEAMAHFADIFNHIFIVTNQQCVAKELISESDLNNIHLQMINDIKSNKGRITEIFSATELKNQKPFRRKPNLTIALEAQTLYPEISFKKSIMIGDTDSDIEFGKNLGMKTVRVLSIEPKTIEADLEVADLWEFAKLLK